MQNKPIFSEYIIETFFLNKLSFNKFIKKKQKETIKANKKQLSTTHSTVIDGHWSVVLGYKEFLVVGSFIETLIS